MLRAFTVILCLLALSVSATNNNNFSGVWDLDLTASDPIDEILKAQGKSRFERRVAKSMAVTQSIMQTGDTMSVHIKSIAMDNTQNFPLDNQWRLVDTPKMGKVNMKNYWLEKEFSIATEMQIKANKKPALMRATRKLTDNGNTMILEILLILQDGRQYRANRVFRREHIN